MPRWLHIAVFAVFGLAGLFALYLPFRFRLPREGDLVARIEAINGLIHEPLAVQTGDIAAGGHDPFAVALWHEHQKRMAKRLRNLQSGLPRPRVPERDPFGLRAAIALFFVTAFAYSFSPNSGRIADAFHIRPGNATAIARVDAWVTPPRYTDRAPVFLTLANDRDQTAITVPQGSILSVRVIGGGSERLTATDARGERRDVQPVSVSNPQKTRTSRPPSMEAGTSATICRKMKRWCFPVRRRIGNSSSHRTIRQKSVSRRNRPMR